jgi:hypothetical protein
MLTVKVDTSGLARLQAELAGKGKQVKFATSRALNAAAYKAKVETEKEIARVFDRPTPWVSKSVRYTKSNVASASRGRAEKLFATIDFEAWGNKQGVTASQVLNAEIHGGARRLKRFEVALNRIGVLPDGMAAVPGKRVKLDQYGNVPASLIVQVLSYFQAFGERYGANSTVKTRAKRWKGTKKTGGFEFFSLAQPQGKLLPGIYMRKNYSAGDRGAVGHLQRDAAFPIFIFVPIPKYKRRFDFYGKIERVAVDEFDRTFPGFLDDAMRTAR